MERSCGGCTACCKTHSVAILNKPSGAWCKHCKIGVGCGIYEERPEECKSFKCSWLMGIGGQQYRPDKVKIVTDYRKICDIGWVMFFWESREGALDSHFTKSWTKRNILAGNCVMHVSLIGFHTLYVSKVKAPLVKSFTIKGQK